MKCVTLLTIWLHQVEPTGIARPIKTIVNTTDCVTSDVSTSNSLAATGSLACYSRDSLMAGYISMCQQRNRRVILALVWTGHTEEALLLLLLVLFSPRRRSAIPVCSDLPKLALRMANILLKHRMSKAHLKVILFTGVQALRILLPWAIRNGAHVVVRKLLSESLSWRMREDEIF